MTSSYGSLKWEKWWMWVWLQPLVSLRLNIIHSGTVHRGKPLANISWTCNTERWVRQIFQRHHINKEKEKGAVIKHGQGDTKWLWNSFTYCIAERCDCHPRVFISELWNWLNANFRPSFHDALSWFSLSSLTRNCVSFIFRVLCNACGSRGKKSINSNMSLLYNEDTLRFSQKTV